MFSYTHINPPHELESTTLFKIQNPFFSNFPSPFFDEHELPFNHLIFPDQSHSPPSVHITHHIINNHPNSSPKKETTTTTKEKPAAADAHHHPIMNGHVAPPSRRRNLGGAGARKRTGKKDRHSKICTAQGVRDRRMRLSQQVARKFFDLQDMLGYDKASKTIEWLFSKSNNAIKDLSTKQGNMSDAKSDSFVSECEEVVSGIEENSNNDNQQMVVVKVKGRNGISAKDVNPKRKPKSLGEQQPNARESRERARARARCRTREKMMSKLRQELGHEERVICPYGGAGGAGDYYPTPADVGTIEKLLQGNSSTSHEPSPTNNLMGFLGNWDHVLNNDRSFQLAAVTNQVSHMTAGNSTLDFPFFHQT